MPQGRALGYDRPDLEFLKVQLEAAEDHFSTGDAVGASRSVKWHERVRNIITLVARWRRSPTLPPCPVRANVPLESMGVTARALVGGMRGMRSHDGFYASHDAHTMELGPPTQIIFRLYSKKKSCYRFVSG